MEQFLNVILSNDLYIAIALSLIILITISIVKKVMKLLFIAAIVLVLFLGYVIYSGTSVKDAADPIHRSIE